MGTHSGVVRMTPDPIASPQGSTLYNVKAVVMRTGVPAPTLRSWERRYGFPAPRRGAHGERWYTPADMEAVQWLRSRVAEGWSISAAVASLRAGSAEPPLTHRAGTPLSSRRLATLATRFLDAAVHCDEATAEAVLDEAAACCCLEDLGPRFVVPAMWGIAQALDSGEAPQCSGAFGAQAVRRRLLRMLSDASLPETAPTALVACVPGEGHDLGALLLSIALRREGVRAVFLGAELGVSDLVDAAERSGARALVLSATVTELAAQVADVAEVASRRVPSLSIGFGGGAYARRPRLAVETPAIYLGEMANVGARELVALLRDGAPSSGS